DSDLGDVALRGALYSASYSALITEATILYGYVTESAPPQWIGHNLVFPTNSLPSGTHAMTIGLVTYMQTDIYNELNGTPPGNWISDVRVEKAWNILSHEQGHTWQYNVLGTNFVPAYFTSIFFGGTSMQALQSGGTAYQKTPFETGSSGGFAPPGTPGTAEAP